MSQAGNPKPGQPGDKKRVFVTYDLEHDGDLYDRLVQQASRRGCSFEICARSTAQPPTDYADEALRDAMRAADEVIGICGEHTAESARMSTELRIAQEEGRPYLLLWGRREAMCTKPHTARPTDSMFIWTWEILQSQMTILRRVAESEARAAQRKEARANRSRA